MCPAIHNPRSPPTDACPSGDTCHEPSDAEPFLVMAAPRSLFERRQRQAFVFAAAVGWAVVALSGGARREDDSRCPRLMAWTPSNPLTAAAATVAGEDDDADGQRRLIRPRRFLRPRGGGKEAGRGVRCRTTPQTGSRESTTGTEGPAGAVDRSLLNVLGLDGAVDGSARFSVSQKNWDHTCERKIQRWWESNGFFRPEARSSHDRAQSPFNGTKGRPYTIPMPPPNVTGFLHIGHAVFLAIQDLLARFHRMIGRSFVQMPI